MALTVCLLALCWLTAAAEDLTRYVDPRIGSEGLGRVFVGPATPFGMVRPGPDCTCRPNSGWLPMPEVVTGFAQTHVSGTGGGPKYGNILIQPYMGQPGGRNHEQRRVGEEMSCGYYSTVFESGVRTEITTADRCAYYRIGRGPSANAGENLCLMVDCGFFLGESPVPNAREAQQFVGSEVELVSGCEVRGFSRIRGGWNNGRAYTVYFCLTSDTPFADTLTWRDADGKTGAWLQFPATGGQPVNLRVGISFVSQQQARRNIPDRSFDEQMALTRSQWDTLLHRITIEGTERQKRMFYTALYHTMLMPSDRTGENPLWGAEGRQPAPCYYDDFYALWDTYRTSLPLITLIDPDRERDIVNALIDICHHDGYLPDARSGNANGRTQGGSHAEVVIADAYAKRLQGIDYEDALLCMLKDADVPPGGNEEQEGRGGLDSYNRLGYVPFGIDRAGTRTVEYAFDDWCIAQVAGGLGRDDVYRRFMRQSENWKNLWRADYEWDGVRGFIMPRSADGQWLDSVPMRGNGTLGQTSSGADPAAPRFLYTPIVREGPWYVPWWGTFFYEATSEEYSLSIPHDVEGLIERCGGKDAFRQRLDRFFDRNYYNVSNEPSFLTPCLYHWIGRPDLTGERVRSIIAQHFDDSPTGIPGNDDSGAMSSWLAFHLMGLYPLAGEARYLVHSPLLPAYTLGTGGRALRVEARNLSEKNRFIGRILLNGQPVDRFWLTHEELTRGGLLVIEMTDRPLADDIGDMHPSAAPPTPSAAAGEWEVRHRFDMAFTLHRQFRTWPLLMGWSGDSLHVRCKEAEYVLPRSVVDSAKGFCWQQPLDGMLTEADGTVGFISREACAQLLGRGSFVYDNTTWQRSDDNPRDGLIHVRATNGGAEMWIDAKAELPFVVELRNNPFGIDWRLE